ncbi:hypothetical protein [Actinomycetospora chiangmaiensis]|uniref:hypothetical protein n=1 Tax=Actinomycetospora chiangmaiensis TaxID=402650 RepID=UPI0003A52975|nr:hypothetical protein [Actinomycetospora chiangmaiensis]
MSLGELGERGAELGRGGQARVVALPELTLPDVPGPLVFKEYKAGQAPVHGLSGIVALRSALPPAHRVVLDACTVWPVRVVHHGPSIAGVVMPLIPGEFLQERTLPSGRAERAPREVQNLFVDPDVAARVGMPLMSLERRLTVCRDLAAALAVLHDLGVVFGDINAKNVLFQRADAASVLLVDCDSVRVRGRGAVVRQLNSPDWDPPEGAVLSQATDMYKFGLFVLRTLSPSAQASVARDPARAAALLEDTGRALLDLALGTDPAERPSASHWANYLAERVAALRGRRSREDRANPSSTPRPPHSAASASGLPGQRGTAASQQRHPDPTQARPRGARATVFPLRPTAGPENRQEVPDTDAVWPTPAAPAAGRHSHHSRTAQDDADSAQHDPPDPAPSPQGRHARPHR